MAGVTVTEVWLGVAGAHIESFDSDGMIAIEKKVTRDDVNRVIEAAKAVAIPADRQVLHVLQKNLKSIHKKALMIQLGCLACD